MKQTHRLDEETVYEIKRELYIGALSQYDLGAKYGVTQTLISQIKMGRTWRRIWFSPTNADRRERDKIAAERREDLRLRKLEAKRRANSRWYQRNTEKKKQLNLEYNAARRNETVQDLPA